MTTKMGATLDDLAHVAGKAEIVNGKIIAMSPTGDEPGFAGDGIFVSLFHFTRMANFGRAVGDNKGFRANLANRESFSPDAAFYTGVPGGMKFFPEPPVFAVEVCSEGDYGPKAEQEMAEKRRDYFAAGTKVVWDVDLLSDAVIKAYHADDPETPTVYRRVEMAEAGPAVPGWKMPVDDLFEENREAEGLTSSRSAAKTPNVQGTRKAFIAPPLSRRDVVFPPSQGFEGPWYCLSPKQW